MRFENAKIARSSCCLKPLLRTNAEIIERVAVLHAGAVLDLEKQGTG